VIIDAHTHIHLDPGAEGQGVADLLAAMHAAGIGKAAVFAAPINGLSTERLLEQVGPYRERLFAVASVSPIMPEFFRPPETVARWLEEGLVRALKFYVGYEHFYPSDERLRPYLELLVKHGRPVIFHGGDLYDKIPGAKLKYSHPLAVDDLAAEMPDLKIVIAHMGSPWFIDAAQVCYKNRNVYADCSGFTYGDFGPEQRRRFTAGWRAFDDILEGGAGKKVVFGTDWPISGIASYLDVVRELAGEDHDLVFSGTAKKPFGL
jgi:hypothetical protein